MARTTVDIAPIAPTSRGLGQQGSGAVQYRPNPNTGNSAGLLAKSLGIAEDLSQQRDERKAAEANQKFELEFNGYVTKALEGDNTTGMEELDLLFPDMSIARKLLILGTSGKKALQRDTVYNEIVAGIGAQNVDDNGTPIGFSNTLKGLNEGYAAAEAYIRDAHKNSNAAFLSGALSVNEASRTAQITQFVTSQRATQNQDAKNDFTETDKSLAASGDWEALQAQDEFWKVAGGNTFIQGGDRNGYITNAAYEQAKDNRDITVLSTMPEQYKGVMRGKPALWQTYLENTQREIDKLNAVDTTARMTADANAKKIRKEELMQLLISGKQIKPQDLREIEADSTLSAARERLKSNTGVDKTFSKVNTTSLVGQLKNARTTEDLSDLGLTEDQLNDAGALQYWARTQDGIHPDDVPAILEAAQSAYYITDVRNSDEHKRFGVELDGVLADVRDVSVLEGDTGTTLGILGQDTTFYRRGKEIAENEFEELVGIYREENGNEKLTLRQLKEIRELVIAKTQKYVEKISGAGTAVIAARDINKFTEDLRNTSNQYKDPTTDVIYEVFDAVKASSIRSTQAGADIRKIGNNRFIQVE